MNRMRSQYEKHFLAYDFVGSAVALCAGVAANYLWPSFGDFLSHLNPIKSTLYGSLFSLAGSLLGFLISAVAIVIAFLEQPRFRLLKESQQGKNIAVVFFNAMRWLAILAGVSFVALLVDTPTSGFRFFLGATAFLSLICALRVYRCAWLLGGLTSIALSSDLPTKSIDRRAA
jgi:hypothetical protein